MPKIIVNYKYDKKNDKYTIIKDDYVYADLPIAVKEKYEDYNDEILIVPINKVATVVDKKEFLSTHKKFKLAVSGELIVEDENGADVYLPIDTDISKLRYINNQIVMLDENQVEEVKEEETKEEVVKEENIEQ